ncbi:alkyl hydroperoxide reductase subunit C [Corynebacterium choanae]|uniref:Alkyl hydroperoxide reductase C n=1 Tax=Corynebacterium choanae TaxID=1862358 RepID=A0A3G6J9S0_9CORY|nr:alkyl hydroperoxide reductase subunit C [Corynebacterium choanae]AZA13190.1 Alkyl hydroperoxide reductase subunit C [Corynebacterium choanae]
MAIINTEAPAWSATAFHNGDFVDVSSEDYKGKWAIVFFYPADFTFVCPTELEDLAEHYSELKDMGVEVYSVSTDKHFTHKAWHASSEKIAKINFPMVGDPTTEISAAFGVLREGEGAADRGTFLIDPDGIIQFVEITSEGVGRNAAELVRKVKAAQYVRNHPGEVCPAKWEEGEDTLEPSFDLSGKL